jgi:hypothetical protein
VTVTFIGFVRRSISSDTTTVASICLRDLMLSLPAVMATFSMQEATPVNCANDPTNCTSCYADGTGFQQLSKLRDTNNNNIAATLCGECAKGSACYGGVASVCAPGSYSADYNATTCTTCSAGSVSFGGAKPWFVVR